MSGGRERFVGLGESVVGTRWVPRVTLGLSEGILQPPAARPLIGVLLFGYLAGSVVSRLTSSLPAIGSAPAR